MNEKNKVEALLFSSGRKMSIEEISRLTGIRNPDVIKTSLNELKKEYEARGSSVMLFEEGDSWKLTVKEHYLPVVQKIITQTELDRPLMETLAIVAWKYPVLQATVVKIRHNKAYDHLRQLEEMSFITRTKYGRTRRITLTQKFFDYFALPNKEKAQEAFKDKFPEDVKKSVERIETEIEESERKAEEMRQRLEEAKRLADEERKKEENIKEELDKMDANEEKEIQEVEKDIKDLKKEEKKEFYSGER
ncbi:SMC-Scp complex subunit ScpB [Candidatus Woesearchaeota archaeon]|nr:SMC-Scp complex subunit ScpB [Candidatus Woesearchaeota archaeon]